MEIQFFHVERPNAFIFTSPQLPGWQCKWPTREIAEKQCANSLRGYLRRNSQKLPSEVRQELWAMLVSS